MMTQRQEHEARRLGHAAHQHRSGVVWSCQVNVLIVSIAALRRGIVLQTLDMPPSP